MGGHGRWGGSALAGLRAVFSLYPEPVTIIARRDAGIALLADLQGKRVNIGSPGSGTHETWDMISATLGWRRQDLAGLTELKPAAARSAPCEGRIDALVLLLGHPNQEVGAMLQDCDARLVGIPEATVAKLIDGRPYFREAVIPAAAYGLALDVLSFGGGATLVTTAGLDDGVVERIVEAVVGRIEGFAACSRRCAISRSARWRGNSLTAPMHPGALRAFQDLGVLPR